MGRLYSQANTKTEKIVAIFIEISSVGVGSFGIGQKGFILQVLNSGTKIEVLHVSPEYEYTVKGTMSINDDVSLSDIIEFLRKNDVDEVDDINRLKGPFNRTIDYRIKYASQIWKTTDEEIIKIVSLLNKLKEKINIKLDKLNEE